MQLFMQAAKTTNRQCEIDAVHVIKRINHYTQGSAMFLFLKSSFLALIEITCYIACIVLISASFFISNENIKDTLAIRQEITAGYSANTPPAMNLFMIVRIILIILSLTSLFIAILLRKIRKKNNLLRKVNEKATDFLERHKMA